MVGPMRWLVVAALGACSFAPGIGSDAGPLGGEDVLVDVPGAGSDALADGTVVTGKVRSIDVIDAQVSGGPHAAFPMVVSISAPWLRSTTNGGDVARDDAFDVSFTSDAAGLSRLAHDLEVYVPTTGELVAWVRVPSLTAATVIYLHYGDPADMTDPQAPASVWDAAYELVAHMDGSGDATGKNTTAGTNLTSTTGKLGPAQTFDGSTSYATFGSAAVIDNLWVGGGTAEAWVFADSYGESGRGRVFDKEGWIFFTYDGVSFNDTLSFAYNDGQWFGADGSLGLGAWHHIAVRYDSGALANKPRFAVDGVAVTTVDLAQPSAGFDDDIYTTFAGDAAGSSRAYDGILDELRLSSVVRSDAWLLTQYRNQASPSTFYTVSAPL